PLPIPIAVRVISRVAEALDYAHRAKDAAGERIELVHRDVSPHNIVIRYDGVVKLLDFGVVKIKAEEQEDHTQSGVVRGKFAYMSPEQCTSGRIDARSDIFSLGICLYELLTGQPLYR